MSPNTRGALLMTGSMAAFTINDAIVKLVGGTMPLFQLITVRGVFSCIMIYFLAQRLGTMRFRFPRQDWIIVLLRCVMEISTTFFFLTALIHLPLANVTAVLQVLPLTVTLGAALFFREKVGWRRMTAIALGFLGMLLIVRPGPDGFNLYSGYALAAVLSITARDLLTRRISADVPSMTVTFTTAVSVTVVAAMASTSTTWVPMTATLLLQLLAASAFIFLGYLFSVMVMRVGDVSFVSPFRYSGLIWALVLGWILFGDWPDRLTLIGAAIVVATGLFTLLRERQIQEK